MKSLLFVLVSFVLSLYNNDKNITDNNTQVADLCMSSLSKTDKQIKKEAKKLKKQGWIAPIGTKSIEQQLNDALAYDSEYIVQDGITNNRYIIQSSRQISPTYDLGYKSALAKAQAQIASVIEVEIISVAQSRLENKNSDNEDIISSSQFKRKIKSYTTECLSNHIPIISLYRIKEDGSYEVYVRIAIDKNLYLKHID